MPPRVGRFERHHIRHRELSQPASQATILSVEGVSHYCTERPPLLDCLLDELQGDLEFGTKVWIVLAFCKIALRGVRLNLQRVIHLLVGPQAGDRNHPVVDLAQIPQVLTPHMSRLVTIFPVPGLIDDQHPTPIGGSRWIFAQETEPSGFHLALTPGGFAEKPLQFLCSWLLCSHHWFSIDQSCQGL